MKFLPENHARPSGTGKSVASAPLSFFPRRGGLTLMVAACMAWNAGPLCAQTQWTGTVDSDWYDAGNWSNGVPSSGESADISADGPVLLTGGTASWLTLRLSGNQSVTVSGGARARGVALNVGDGSPAEMLLTGTDTVVSLSAGKTSLGIRLSSAMTISDGALMSAVTTDASTLPVLFQAGGGTLNLNSGGILATARLGSSAPAGTKINFDGGILRSVETASTLFHNLVDGAVELHAGGGTFDTNSFNIGITNGISGIGDFVKAGAGTLTLSGANTFSGATRIEAGSLAMTGGSLAASSGIDIASGATFDVSALAGGFTLGAAQTLSGNGTILGDVTNAGIVAPGSSPGTLVINGNFTQSESGILDIEIAGLLAGSQHDLLDIDGEAILSGAIRLTLDNFAPSVNDSFQIMQFDSLVDNGFAFDLSAAILGSGLSWNFDQFHSTGTIYVIPEPAAASLMAL